MTKPVRITVRGSDNLGDDAPTVEDLVAQIQDFVLVLHEVEEAIAGEGKEEIVWRVTDATRNSPLSFELTPYPKSHATNIDLRAAGVVAAAANGLQMLTSTDVRPAHFTDRVIDTAERFYERVTNGLATTTIDFGLYEGAPSLELNRRTARLAVDHISKHKVPSPASHRELGSLEGFIARVELDGYGRPVVWLRSRLDGQLVKCIANSGGLDRIGHFEVAEVLKGLRIRVQGLLNYRSLEQISSIEVDRVHVFDADSDLPDFDSIVSPDFTGGLEASQYLEVLRQDG